MTRRAFRLTERVLETPVRVLGSGTWGPLPFTVGLTEDEGVQVTLQTPLAERRFFVRVPELLNEAVRLITEGPTRRQWFLSTGPSGGSEDDWDIYERHAISAGGDRWVAHGMSEATAQYIIDLHNDHEE